MQLQDVPLIFESSGLMTRIIRGGGGGAEAERVGGGGRLKFDKIMISLQQRYYHRTLTDERSNWTGN